MQSQIFMVLWSRNKSFRKSICMLFEQKDSNESKIPTSWNWKICYATVLQHVKEFLEGNRNVYNQQ